MAVAMRHALVGTLLRGRPNPLGHLRFITRSVIISAIARSGSSACSAVATSLLASSSRSILSLAMPFVFSFRVSVENFHWETTAAGRIKALITLWILRGRAARLKRSFNRKT